MKLFIIVPCYNEEAVLAETTVRLQAVCRQLEEAKRWPRHIYYMWTTGAVTVPGT